VFNQRQEAVPYSEVTVDSKVIPLIKVDCIRFSARSFAIELTLPQLMVLESPAGARGCMIRAGEDPEPSKESILLDVNETVLEPIQASVQIEDAQQLHVHEPVKEEEPEPSRAEEPHEPVHAHEPVEVRPPMPEGVTAVALDDIEPSDEAVELRKPNEVYRQIYDAALAKAKLAKKTAVEAYLEARRIRHMYLLDDLEQSDDEEMTEME